MNAAAPAPVLCTTCGGHFALTYTVLAVAGDIRPEDLVLGDDTLQRLLGPAWRCPACVHADETQPVGYDHPDYELRNAVG